MMNVFPDSKGVHVVKYLYVERLWCIVMSWCFVLLHLAYWSASFLQITVFGRTPSV